MSTQASTTEALPGVKVHPSAFVDSPCSIGAGSQVWHFSHVMAHAEIGERCIFGQNVFIASRVKIGNNCKVQNNVSLYEGVVLEDDVFCGPSCVFTNVMNPRSQIVRRNEYRPTVVSRGATLGANCTVVCGDVIGRYAFIAAGALVRGNVPQYALMMGVPARQQGWMSRHGFRLVEDPNEKGLFVCPESKWRYRCDAKGVLSCLDWPEDQSLPEETKS